MTSMGAMGASVSMDSLADLSFLDDLGMDNIEPTEAADLGGPLAVGQPLPAEHPTGAAPARSTPPAGGRSSPELASDERRLTFEQIFGLLEAAELGRFSGSVPVRTQASPICTDVPCFFVSPDSGRLLPEQERVRGLGDPSTLVGVKYQSFSNGEVWWSSRGRTMGVVARNMSRKIRNSKPGVKEQHGFSGRWYCLLRRASASEELTGATCRSFVVAGAPSLVQFWPIDLAAPQRRKRKLTDQPSFAAAPLEPEHTQPPAPAQRQHQRQHQRQRLGSETSCDFVNSAHMPSHRSRGTESLASEASDSTSSTLLPPSPHDFSGCQGQGQGQGQGLGQIGQANRQPQVAQKTLTPIPLVGAGVSPMIECVHDPDTEEGTVVVRGGFRVEGDAVFRGNLTARSLRVTGTLTVEGGISGQLTSPPGNADYAEWFEKLDHAEDIRAGDVVQLRSPQQKITLDTGSDGPLLIVSTTPSVAAGMPFGAARDAGKLCAFIGQVPVRCTGPVAVGDALVPSGLSDGLAIAGVFMDASACEPLGTAMEACGAGEQVVLSFVRWPHSQAWQQLRSQNNEHHRGVENIWARQLMRLAVTVAATLLLAQGVYVPTFDARPLKGVLALDLLTLAWSMLHFPNYVEFVVECKYHVAVVVVKALVCAWLLYGVFGAFDGERAVASPLSKLDVRDLLVDTAFLVYKLSTFPTQLMMYRQVRASIMDRGKALGEVGMASHISDFQRRKRLLLSKVFGVEIADPAQMQQDEAMRRRCPSTFPATSHSLAALQQSAMAIEAVLGADKLKMK